MKNQPDWQRLKEFTQNLPQQVAEILPQLFADIKTETDIGT